MVTYFTTKCTKSNTWAIVSSKGDFITGFKNQGLAHQHAHNQLWTNKNDTHQIMFKK